MAADKGYALNNPFIRFSHIMIYRQLGNTGIRVSAVALGCEGFVDKTAEEVRSDFDYAISQGINFVDIYSSNPELRTCIGKALAGRRENFVIQAHLCTTWEKGQYLRTRDIDKTKKAFELLLQQLQTDYLDVGMIHYVDDERDFHQVFDGPIIDFARQLKQEGSIHSLGMSSHNPIVARMAVETGLIDVLMFSINPCYDMQPPGEDVEQLWAEENYSHALQNIDPDRERLYELCESRGVGIDVMKVYGGGDLLSEANSPFGRALTPSQCMEYALTRPAVAAAMVGCHSTDEMKQALHWCDATKEERDYSLALSGLKQFTWKGHCMYCGHCAPCSVGIDIASVNKFFNLTEAQGMIPETVRDHYKLLKHHASECIQCGKCEKNCPFGVSIMEAMKKAAKRFGY
jgi:predicted aldo/keto reductase-like oxidoreductase